jgi:hypothetical protein
MLEGTWLWERVKKKGEEKLEAAESSIGPVSALLLKTSTSLLWCKWRYPVRGLAVPQPGWRHTFDGLNRPTWEGCAVGFRGGR